MLSAIIRPSQEGHKQFDHSSKKFISLSRLLSTASLDYWLLGNVYSVLVLVIGKDPDQRNRNEGVPLVPSLMYSSTYVQVKLW